MWIESRIDLLNKTIKQLENEIPEPVTEIAEAIENESDSNDFDKEQELESETKQELECSKERDLINEILNEHTMYIN